MRRRLGIAAAMAFGLLAAARPALAQGMVPPMPDPRGGQGSLVLHQPIQSGGPAADTAFLDMLGNPFWQQVSDNILIPESGTVRQIVWWGFYNLDNPPAEETMRVRSCGRFDGAECFLRHQEGLFKDTILSGNTDGMRAPVVLREWIADVRGGRMV